MPKYAVPYAAPPVLERPSNAQFSLGGVVGERVKAALHGWLLPAPDANPALTEMFRDRNRTSSRELVPWAGEFVGKYLIAAQQILRLTGDKRLRSTIGGIVAELIAAQDEDGYLGPFDKENRLVEKWDVWGHYHVMLALLMYYEASGSLFALSACRKMADLLHSFFVVGNRRMLTRDDPDGEKNYAVSHAVLWLYRITGEAKYRELVDWIEKEWDVPPAGQYISSALAGVPVWKFPSHRWESAHGYEAIAELGLLTGDERYARVARHIWWSILEGDRHNTGGFTSGEACQGNPYDQGAIETCCTMAWIAFSIDVLRMTGDPRIADEIELATLNGMVGGQNPAGRWWTYNTPMDGRRVASAQDIVFQSRAGSPELNCCSVNAPRGLGMISEWGFMVKADGFAVNYYGPSAVTLRRPSGETVRLQQDTSYPVGNEVVVGVGCSPPAEFTLSFRIPAWSKATRVAVNGEAVRGVEPGTYCAITRKWREGDTVKLVFDFSPHAWVGEKECAGKVSLYRGPILLAFDPRFNTMDPDAVPTVDVGTISFEPAAFSGKWPPWLLVRVPTVDGRELLLCDFANAGSTGTHYRSWIPCVGGEPRAFSRDRAVWV